MNMRSLFLGLPLHGQISAIASLLLLLIFLVSLLAKKCVFRLRGHAFLKDHHALPNGLHNGEATANAPTCHTTVGVSYKATLSCCIYVLVCHILVASWVLREAKGSKWAGNSGALFVSQILQVATWVVMCAVTYTLKRHGEPRLPLVLRAWWTVSLALCLCGISIDALRFVNKHQIPSFISIINILSIPALAFLCFVSFKGRSGIQIIVNSDLEEPLLESNRIEENGCERVTSYSEAGIFSLATLSWLNPLLAVGSKRPLELKDVPLLAANDRAESSYQALKGNWEKLRAQNSTEHPSLTRAIFMSFWKEALWNGMFAGVNTLVSYVGPFLISYFVDYLGGKQVFRHEGYVLALVFFVAKLVEIVTTRQWYLGVDILGMHVRAALTALVYEKGLRLSSLSRQSHTSGEIINYMAVDVQRIGDYSWYLHDIWMLPMQIVLALAILFKNVGIAAIATLIATIVSIFINTPLAKMQEEYQDNLMTAKDERMKATSECLRNMRIMKLQAWEDRYRLKLEDFRKIEFVWLKKALYSQAFVTFIFWGSPIFVSVVTFGTCILLGGQLTAGEVLSALATFRILQEPLRNFPDLVSMIAQTKVSLDRISGFLKEEELPSDATISVPKNLSELAIEILDGNFSWDPCMERPTLAGINLKVKRGMRVAVCGMVGSGKSSFLSCILGEIPKVSGQVKISGSTAYVSQSAWIQTGNIEENILFGSQMDKARYKNVIQACALKKDLGLFSHGDQTIIGERGINLSGGQKQRVQLARALYQDADIYLLDDPFSAVDAHTGTELFKEYILGALALKTVVFITHQVEFLPTADLILTGTRSLIYLLIGWIECCVLFWKSDEDSKDSHVLRYGRIIQAGKYEDLLQAGTDFDTLVSAHHEAIEAMDVAEYIVDEPDETNKSSSVGVIKEDDSKPCEISNLPKQKMEKELSSDKKRKKEKKANRMRKKQLIQEEERERGNVSFQVYWSYLTAAYKGALVPLIIFSQVAFQALQIGSNWWMAWANPPTDGQEARTSSLVLILVYMGLAFGSTLFVFMRALLVATFGLKASQKLFNNMLRCIFRAPMSFFDSTPAGRILSRVSIDQSVVDLDIPFRLGGFASTTIQLLGIIGVMSRVTWQVLVLFVPMAMACLWMQVHVYSVCHPPQRCIPTSVCISDWTHIPILSTVKDYKAAYHLPDNTWTFFSLAKKP
eukprot:Gb_35586 [translate_table: standard]